MTSFMDDPLIRHGSKAQKESIRYGTAKKINVLRSTYKSVFFQLKIGAVFLESGFDFRRTRTLILAEGLSESFEDRDTN